MSKLIELQQAIKSKEAQLQNLKNELDSEYIKKQKFNNATKYFENMSQHTWVILTPVGAYKILKFEFKKLNWRSSCDTYNLKIIDCLSQTKLNIIKINTNMFDNYTNPMFRQFIVAAIIAKCNMKKSNSADKSTKCNTSCDSCECVKLTAISTSKLEYILTKQKELDYFVYSQLGC